MAPIIAALEEFGPRKPVVFAMLGEDSEVPPEIIAKLRGLDVPFFRSPERALRALARLAGLQAPAPASSARPAIERADQRLPAGVIPEYVAKGLLAEAGIPVPRAELVSDLAGARQVAARIGYPVVLKAQSAGARPQERGGRRRSRPRRRRGARARLGPAPCRYRRGAPGSAARWRAGRGDGAPGRRAHRGGARRSRLGPGSGRRPGRRVGRGAARRAGIAGGPGHPPRSWSSSIGSRPLCC